MLAEGQRIVMQASNDGAMPCHTVGVNGMHASDQCQEFLAWMARQRIARDKR